MKKHFFLASTVFAAVCLVGCAQKQVVPSSEMALAEDAVAEASSAGAYEFAPLEIEMAEDKIEQAKIAIQAKNNLEAKRLLEKAQVDAKLAESKARTAKTQKSVNELQKSIDVLREEIERKAAE